MKVWEAPALALALGLVVFAGIALLAPARADIINFEFYGSNSGGWGRDPGNMTKPGPFLTYSNGTQLRLTLHSQDTRTHNFFVDYNGDGSNASEPSTGDFFTLAGTTFPPITLTRQGNFTYRCIYHNAMTGKLNITASAGGGLGGGTVFGTLLSWNLIIILAIVAAVVIAGVAVLLRTRGRRPPRDEEESPPPRGPRAR